ncbi:MAG: hypothetical protein KIG84_10080 [Bacteroidales bacterium]|nr:hypothetical protein [Bacteroidales bacterium]
MSELKADYKEACGRLQTANLIKNEQLSATRHQKYKRCMAMAWWCDAEQYAYPSFGTGSPKEKWWQKWHNRWLKLTEKFKEVK